MVEQHHEGAIHRIGAEERGIGEETKCASIVGKHILSGQLVRDPQQVGDGYVITEAETGKLVVAIMDISLGKSRSSTNQPIDNTLIKIIKSGKVTELMSKIPTHKPLPSRNQPVNDKLMQITEYRMLKDLKHFLNVFIENMGLTKGPAGLLNEVSKYFLPEYLRTRQHIVWGYSLSVAYLDKQTEAITIASVGKNFVGRQSPNKEDQFISVFGDNSKFYSPRKTHKGVGGPVETKSTSLPWGQTFIMATDGIKEEKPFLFPPKIVLQQIPNKSPIRKNNEGLYLVIKPK